jgi:hypothetical protein
MEREEHGSAGNRQSLLSQAEAPAPGARAAAPRSRSDVWIIQTALAFEHGGIAAYRIAGKSGLLSPGTLHAAQVFMGHHEAHRDSLARLVREAGAEPVEPRSDAHYIAELDLGSLKSEKDVVALATSLEHGAASAYIGQINAIRDPKLANLFAAISADEATHWATLVAAAGGAIPRTPFIFRGAE